jgi:hypothetical protein
MKQRLDREREMEIGRERMKHGAERERELNKDYVERKREKEYRKEENNKCESLK